MNFFLLVSVTVCPFENMMCPVILFVAIKLSKLTVRLTKSNCRYSLSGPIRKVLATHGLKNPVLSSCSKFFTQLPNCSTKQPKSFNFDNNVFEKLKNTNF